MTKQEKQYYFDKPTIGYVPTMELGGVEIKEIEYGVEDHIVFVIGTAVNKISVHRARIYYTESPYFVYNGVRIYLDMIMRVNT